MDKHLAYSLVGHQYAEQNTKYLSSDAYVSGHEPRDTLAVPTFLSNCSLKCKLADSPQSTSGPFLLHERHGDRRGPFPGRAAVRGRRALLLLEQLLLCELLLDLPVRHRVRVRSLLARVSRSPPSRHG